LPGQDSRAARVAGRASAARAATGIPTVLAHDSYLLNLAVPVGRAPCASAAGLRRRHGGARGSAMFGRRIGLPVTAWVCYQSPCPDRAGAQRALPRCWSGSSLRPPTAASTSSSCAARCTPRLRVVNSPGCSTVWWRSTPEQRRPWPMSRRRRRSCWSCCAPRSGRSAASAAGVPASA